MIAKFFLPDNLNKDMKEATEFRDSLRSEAKDWEKKFSVLQKERAKEVEVTKRQLRERQELYLGIDTYLLRCRVPQLYPFILTSYLLPPQVRGVQGASYLHNINIVTRVWI